VVKTEHNLLALDALLGLSHLWTPEAVWSVIAVGIVGSLANLGLRLLRDLRALRAFGVEFFRWGEGIHRRNPGQL